MPELKQRDQLKDKACENILDSYTKALKNYVNFAGRTSRYDYWGFYAVNFMISLFLGLVSFKVYSMSLVSQIYSLAVFVPTWAAIARRLHDVGKSAFWYLFLPVFVLLLLGFVGVKTQNPMMMLPVIGGGLIYVVLVLIWLCKKGEKKDNEYGAQIVETSRQQRVGKYLCLGFVLLPLVLFVAGVLSAGFISGYSKAKAQYNQNQRLFNQHSVIEQGIGRH